MTSTVYSRPSKLPGGGCERRLPLRLMRSLTTKIEPKKLGVGLVAGCCLALLTYVSLAKLFAIYSLTRLPLGAPVAATEGSEEPGLPEALLRMVDAEKTTATSEPKPSEVGEEKKSNGDAAVDAKAAKMTCDENGVDEDFPYARPTVCELSGDIHVSPKQKTMYLVNPSSASGFDEHGEKRLRPYARKDDFLPLGIVEVTVKSIPSAASAPQCMKHRLVPVVVFFVAGYTDNFFHDIELQATLESPRQGQPSTSPVKGQPELFWTSYDPLK